MGGTVPPVSDLVPNHHADYPQFTGLAAYVAGMQMVVRHRSDAVLAGELTGVGDGESVLDIGCGPGSAARRAAERGADVVAIDPSAPMLRMARLLTRLRRPPGPIEWLRAGAEAIPLPDDSQDIVWSLACVHHWPDLDAGVAETLRVLKPGGRFLALERRTVPGATGMESHGWTDDQAERFASMLLAAGCRTAEPSTHERDDRRVVVVLATL